MTVNTPTAVAGVRGTKFGVAVDDVSNDVTVHCYRGPVDAMPTVGAGQQAAVNSDLYLADASGSDFRHLLAQGPEGGTSDSVRLWDGDSWNQKMGLFRDAGRQEEFNKDTFIGAVISGEVEPSDDTGANPLDSKSMDEADNAGQGQSGLRLDDQAGAIGTGKYLGYFTGIVTNQYWGSYGFPFVYVSNTRQDFGSSSITAEGLPERVLAYDMIPPGPGDAIVANPGGAGFENPYIESVTTHEGTAVLGTEYAVDNDMIGHYGTFDSSDYLEWGWWVLEEKSFLIPPISGDEHDLWTGGLYIFGTALADDSSLLSGVNGISGNYMGDAYAIFWSWEGLGSPGQGDFYCNVDTSKADYQITNFHVCVDELGAEGEGQWAEISGAKGTMNGSSFTIDHATGTWYINGYEAERGAAHGSLYTGHRIGGVFGMSSGEGYYYYGGGAVQGIFVGGKTTQPLPD
jgi:hypothetical protein